MGYCLHANGFQFPLHIPGDYTTKSPAELWDQVPTNGKLQILGFVAFLEFFGELGGRVGAPAHYMRGGLPGAYPSFKKYLNGVFPHPVPLNLWDPFGFTSKMTPERKEKALLAEINNGRLAQIGIFGLGTLMDTTGAGDLYAGGFLHAYTQGESLERCGQLGALCAGQIVTQLGARSTVSLRDLAVAHLN